MQPSRLAGLFLLVAQLGNPKAGVAVDDGENKAGIAEDGPGQILQRLHAQAGRHIRAGGGPGDQRHEDRTGILQGAGEVLCSQTPLPVGVAEHLAGDQNGQIGVAGGQSHGNAGDNRGQNQRAGALGHGKDLLQNHIQAAGPAHDSGEAEGAEDQQRGAHYSVHAASGQQTLNTRITDGCIEASLGNHGGVEPADGAGENVLQAGSLENYSFHTGQQGAAQHHGDGRLLQQGPGKDQYHRQQQKQIPVEHHIQLVEHGSDSVGGDAHAGIGIETHNGIDDQRDDGRRDRGVEHVADVLIEVAARSDGGQIGSIRQRGHLVAEVGTGDDRTGRGRQGNAQSAGNAHQRHAHGGHRAPRGTGDHGDHGGNQEGRDQHPVGVDDLDAVVNHHRNGARSHPGAHHCADRDQDQNGGHTLGNFGRDFIHHLIPGAAHAEGNNRRYRRHNNQQRLGAVPQHTLADGENQQHGDNRNNGLQKRRRPLGTDFLFFLLFLLFHDSFLRLFIARAGEISTADRVSSACLLDHDIINYAIRQNRAENMQ